LSDRVGKNKTFATLPWPPGFLMFMASSLLWTPSYQKWSLDIYEVRTLVDEGVKNGSHDALEKLALLDFVMATQTS